MARERDIEILVVDDEGDLRSMLGQFLRREGYRVTEAACGEDALQELSRRGANVQLLITDIVMPGMNGCELAQEVRRTFPHIRRLLMSGYPRGVLEPGAVLLKKPFSLKVLLQRIEEVLADTSKSQAVGVSAGSV